MTVLDTDQSFERLVHKFDPQSRLLRSWELQGGVSAQVTALEIERATGQRKKMVVRQHGEADLQANPHIAADEFRLLQGLQSAGLPAPKPYYVETSGDIFPTPSIVIEFVDGELEFTPSDLTGFIHQFATHLAQIHGVDKTIADLSFLPEQEARVAERLRNRPVKLDGSIDESRIRAALEAAWPWPQHNPSTLLHGDYWPGNLLWKEGQLVAVIDWEDAALGDPLSDLANSRLEILWAFGIDAMHHFTDEYQTQSPGFNLTSLAYWDLYASLHPALKFSDWAADAATEARMRERHRLFVKQAFEQLSR